MSDSELYFARCCALKRTGTFATESKVNVFVLTDFRSDVLIFYQCVNSYFETENS